MATYTNNLNLKKPSTNENYDVVADLNDAKDKIDAAIGNIYDKTEIDDKLQGLNQESDITITVGIGGDFSTINDAIFYISKKNITYKKQGVKVELKLLSGFIMEEQILVDGIDLSYITISSEDIQVDINRAALITAFDSVMLEANTNVYPAFGVRNNGTLPRIDVLFYMTNAGADAGRHCFVYLDGGKGTILPGAGCLNAGENGIYLINGAYVTAYGARFENSYGANVRVFRGSYLNFRAGISKNAGTYGIYMGSSSTVEALGAVFTGNGSHGIWIYANGQISVRDGDISGNGGAGILGNQNAKVEASFCNLSGNEYGIQVSSNCDVDAQNALINNNIVSGIRAEYASKINATNAEIKNNGNHGIHAIHGSKIIATNIVCTENVGYGTYAETTSDIIANRAIITGNTPQNVYANRGSKIDIGESDCTLATGLYDIRMRRGSIIIANDSTGILDPSVTVNTPSIDGIVFK